MTACEYRLLGYAKSETDAAARAFLVTLRLLGWGDGAIRGWVLDEWWILANVADEFDLSHIEDLLHDLEFLNFRDPGAGERFYESIKSLNTGPIRTVAAGRLEHPPEELMNFMTSGDAIQRCTPQIFDEIILKLGEDRQSPSGRSTPFHLV